MSYLDTLYTQCEDLQGRLSQVFTNSMELQTDRSPFLEFLLSPVNTNGLQQTVNPGQGKTRTLNLIYDQPVPESSVTTESNRDCRTADKRGDFVQTYEIDTTRVFEYAEQIAIVDLTKKCENNPDFMARRVLQCMIGVERKVATQSATEAAAITGDYSADVVTAKGLSDPGILEVITKDANGNFVAGALEEIQWAANTSLFQNPVMFNGYLLDQHIRTALVGCCTRWGVEAGEMLAQYGFANMYDRRVATALGGLTTKGLLVDTGAMQLLHYTENPALDGLDDFIRTQNLYTTMISPSGIPMDVTIKDDCKKITIQVQACTKVVGKPTNLFAAGDNFAGVNGSAIVKVDNPSA